MMLSMAALAAVPVPVTMPLDKTVTMFHVNPRRYGPIPINMDTADAVGDLFFELMESMTVPLACADKTVPAKEKPIECENPEASDPTDVVNKLTVQVNSNYSQYAMCNIGINGSDPFGRPCPTGQYCCFCNDYNSHSWPPKQVPCNATAPRA